MKSGSKTPTAELLDQLDRLAVEALHRHGLYSPDAAGWLNADDPDPEFIGYAIWAISAPHDAAPGVWDSRMYSELDELTKAKALAGEDFFYYLELAWRGMGLTLLYAEHREHSWSSQQDVTWYHLGSSLVALAIASDRIRDLFVLATYGLKLRAYRFGEKGAYPRPFQDFANQAPGQRSGEVVTLSHRLVGQAMIVDPVRKLRNVLVHEIASQHAQTLRELINRPPPKEQGPTSEDMLRASQFEHDLFSHNAGIDQRVGDIKSMYTALVRMGSDVFELEHMLRNSIPTKPS